MDPYEKTGAKYATLDQIKRAQSDPEFAKKFNTDGTVNRFFKGNWNDVTGGNNNPQPTVKTPPTLAPSHQPTVQQQPSTPSPTQPPAAQLPNARMMRAHLNNMETSAGKSQFLNTDQIKQNATNLNQSNIQSAAPRSNTPKPSLSRPATPNKFQDAWVKDGNSPNSFARVNGQQVFGTKKQG